MLTGGVGEGGSPGTGGQAVPVRDGAGQGAQGWVSLPQKLRAGPQPLVMTVQEQLLNEGKEAGENVSLLEKKCDKLFL